MRKIKVVLRLKFQAKLSHELIAAAPGLSKGAVTNHVQRAVRRGLGWPLPEDLEEAGLEALLFKQAAPNEHYAAPDWMMWTPGGYAEICIGRATPACPRRPPAA